MSKLLTWSIRSIDCLAAGLVLSLVSASPSPAVTVTIGSTDYDVSFFVGTFTDNQSLFQVPSAGKVPWWVDPSGTIASDFAQSVFDQLGEGPVPGYGPVFAYDSDGVAVQGIVQSLTNTSSQLDQPFSPSIPIKYAIATPISQPSTANAPGPLPVLGVFAAYKFSRRLRSQACP
jgi:hypothetical protein